MSLKGLVRLPILCMDWALTMERRCALCRCLANVGKDSWMSGPSISGAVWGGSISR